MLSVFKKSVEPMAYGINFIMSLCYYLDVLLRKFLRNIILTDRQTENKEKTKHLIIIILN